jgi:hypothetical protein
MFDLRKLSVSDMIRCSSAVRRLHEGAKSMEDVAASTAQLLYRSLLDGAAGGPACALVRIYKTHPLGDLKPEDQAFARGLLSGEEASPETRCFTLLGTAGDEPQWNSRATSAGHKAIPLATEPMIQRLPMIAGLLEQLGLPASALAEGGANTLRGLEQKSFNLFHIERAKGSPVIPAQADFVERYGIASVIGFGGVLPSADVFAILLFSKVPVGREVAELLNALPLHCKLALLRFAQGPIFN